MRRADRLFQIIQLLRARGVVTAAALAAELEVSARTIYRDVADLVGSGVPIDGEAGVGYALPRHFELPPLMFSQDEVEILVLGARIVESWGGKDFARHARSALTKVHNVLPPKVRARIEGVPLHAPGYFIAESVTANLEPLRLAIGAKRKVRFGYTGEDGAATERTVRPLGLAYWGNGWTATGWCELRSAFRTFRPGRMHALCVLQETFVDEPDKDWAAFVRSFTREREPPSPSR